MLVNFVQCFCFLQTVMRLKGFQHFLLCVITAIYKAVLKIRDITIQLLCSISGMTNTSWGLPSIFTRTFLTVSVSNSTPRKAR